MEPEDLESFICRLIAAGDESEKVDFKEKLELVQKRERAELAKLLSAIANSDSFIYDNYGYVVLGARRRELTGGLDELASDQFSAGLQQSINAYLDPPVHFEVKAFRDPDKGWFGAIIIPPSAPHQRPHFIGREYTDNQFSILKGQCWVRIGDRIELAQKSDYERMYHARYKDDIERLRNELEQIRHQRPEIDVYIQLQDGLSKEVATTVDVIANRPTLDERVQQEERTLLSVLEQPKESPSEALPSPLGTPISTLRETIEALQVALSAAAMNAPNVPGYRKEVTEYLDAYRSFIAQSDAYEDFYVRLRPVQLILQNNGKVPAEDVVLLIEFPDGIAVYDEAALLSKPEPPLKPRLSTLWETRRAPIFLPTGDWLSRSMASTLSNIKPPLFANVSGPHIERGQATQVRFDVKRLQHQLPEALDAFYVMFPSAEVGQDVQFRISYTVYAGNLPEPERGGISIRVKYGSRDWANLIGKQSREQV